MGNFWLTHRDISPGDHVLHKGIIKTVAGRYGSILDLVWVQGGSMYYLTIPVTEVSIARLA